MRLSLGRRSFNPLPVAQRINALTRYVVAGFVVWCGSRKSGALALAGFATRVRPAHQARPILCYIYDNWYVI